MLRYKLSSLFIALCILVLVSSLAQLLLQRKQYKVSSDVYSSLTEFVATPTSEPETVNPDLNPTHNGEPAYKVESHEAPQAESIFPSIDFYDLRVINPDITAWLICDGTPINYPIVQGIDNTFYLTHLFDGKPNKAGCLFTDSDNAPDFTDNNTVIYGHNMKNKSMFTTLVEYKKQSFYDSYPRMLLLTPSENYVVEIFAGYVTDTDDESWKIRFNDRVDFSNWIANARAKSFFNSDMEVTATARIITLSTCTYEFDNARFVLHGILTLPCLCQSH